jgi:uncharacterized protein (TIGR04222 family)
MNALDLKGPEFLGWYLQMFALASAACFILRWLMRRASDPAPDGDLDTYEIAWLKDGPRGVVRAALVALHRRELISIYASQVMSSATAPNPGLPAIEQAVLQALDTQSKLPAQLERDLARQCDAIQRRLAERRLALSPAWEAVVCGLPLLGVVLCIWTGAVKLAIGLSNNRPVGVLVCLLAGSVVLVVSAVRRRPRRTTAGDRRLKALARRHAALRTTLDTTANVAPDDAGLAVALWGQAALGTVAFMSFAYLVDPRKAFGANGWGSSSSGGCSTSGGGDSGGGGDGGGGGCGGGCGGCGGCGG